MKIQYMSDIHGEWGQLLNHDAVHTDSDIVVLAGDIANYSNVSSLIKELFPEKTVVYCAGNHEFYGDTATQKEVIAYLRKSFHQSQEEGYKHYFLENDTLYLNINGEPVRVVGCTLWSDMKLHGNQIVDSIRIQMEISDFRRIIQDDGGDYITPADYFKRFEESKSFLKDELSKEFDGKTIVLTHFLPTEKMIHSQYKDNPNNPAYASHLGSIVDYGQFNVWFCGHSHKTNQIDIDGKIIAMNPAGYPNVELKTFQNRNFDPKKTLDI